MTELEIRKTAVELLNCGSLDGLELRSRYYPQDICYKCGRVPSGITVTLNGVPRCENCELPITMGQKEVRKQIVDRVAAALEADGEFTIAHIQRQLFMATPGGLKALEMEQQEEETARGDVTREATEKASRSLEKIRKERKKAEERLERAVRAEKTVEKILGTQGS